VSLERTGGILLVVGAALALIWANSPYKAGYYELINTVVGFKGPLHLDLTLQAWAADGLLAIFFFVVGLELKREFVVGDLHNPRKAILPIVAAIAGMAIPALIYVAIVLLGGVDALKGWAVPTATDIAFALAVLAIFGKGFPAELRTFLLTLAVVDDLFAITIIAIFYTAGFSLFFFLLTLIPLAAYAVLVQRGKTGWWYLLPLALLTWALLHESGVHATIAGVALGFTVPAIPKYGQKISLAEKFEEQWRPISQGIALPLFAFFAAGVTVVGIDLAVLIREPVLDGIVLGLVVGKLVGIMAAVFILTRFRSIGLPPGVRMLDMVPIGLLAGIGFTVSLLISELAFVSHPEFEEEAKIGVLAASVIAAVLAAFALRWRISRFKQHRAEH
jgi:NhaA family Na+:H+ antiporter